MTWTLGDIRSKIKDNLDLIGETFIDDSELNGYINDGIDLVEAVIHSLNEDYFLTKTNLTLTSGDEYVTLPSNIYAQKIRSLFYVNGDTKYPVRRLKQLKEAAFIQEGDLYRYILINNEDEAVKINILPTPAETGSYLRCHYIRNAKFLEEDTDVCDIPEFVNYVIEVAKVLCKSKEYLDPSLQKEALAEIEDKLKTVLPERVEDEDNEIELGPCLEVSDAAAYSGV
jgi:hypothetical protein